MVNDVAIIVQVVRDLLRHAEVEKAHIGEPHQPPAAQHAVTHVDDLGLAHVNREQVAGHLLQLQQLVRIGEHARAGQLLEDRRE